jgi:alpha-L-fucosidase
LVRGLGSFCTDISHFYIRHKKSIEEFAIYQEFPCTRSIVSDILFSRFLIAIKRKPDPGPARVRDPSLAIEPWSETGSVMTRLNRRQFVGAAALYSCASIYPRGFLAAQEASQGFPLSQLERDPYIERIPIESYDHAPRRAYEAFQDMKFGARIHWGIYSLHNNGAESWPFLRMSFEERQDYNQLYKQWNPRAFDANAWMSLFAASGMKMFAFTTKHHEGFSLFETRTRVKSRANWASPGGPTIESCDLAYSIMETPFGRDVVKELCDAAQRKGIAIDLYFSHPDWYDADFRPYVAHPLQVPSSANLLSRPDLERTRHTYGDHPVVVADPSSDEVSRMIRRHRAQLVELLTNYGKIDMMCLDMSLGPEVWPQLRETVLMLRKLQPDVMLRNRGIGNYGDYFTPERAVPSSKVGSDRPWFCINPLGTDFSYEPDGSKYKGTAWIVHTLADTVAKGGGLMVGVGPNSLGEFHPEAVRQMKDAGAWLKVNGEAIYATRPRDGTQWSEGNAVLYTRSKDRRNVYAILTEWPGAQVVLASVRPRQNSAITLLGSPAKIQWTFDSTRGTTIVFPESLQSDANRPCQHAWSLRMEDMTS